MDNITPKTVCQSCLECDKRRTNDNMDGCMGRARAEDCPEKLELTKEEAAALICSSSYAPCKECLLWGKLKNSTVNNPFSCEDVIDRAKGKLKAYVGARE